MDIQTRKLEFIQDFLKLQSEEVIAQFEKLLRNAKNIEAGNTLEPLTVEELNNRISQSENDFKNKKFKTTSDLLSKY
ncbi:hypothetical protein VUJ46_16160 [Chryseobacterium sp. MYb264]|uniref:hypothetical protein n=1 Tax=Chryseobacterium sp. MYb264 TaxID=2745153 RepID=UPI002E132785|nr:hypothetical protein VUJ46_16160 [Chryseobacterium sp. MYb264]